MTRRRAGVRAQPRQLHPGSAPPRRDDLQQPSTSAACPAPTASVEWDEDISPYRTVATVTLPPQETLSPARRLFAELGAWRHEQNAVTEQNSTSLGQVLN